MGEALGGRNEALGTFRRKIGALMSTPVGNLNTEAKQFLRANLDTALDEAVRGCRRTRNMCDSMFGATASALGGVAPRRFARFIGGGRSVCSRTNNSGTDGRSVTEIVTRGSTGRSFLAGCMGVNSSVLRLCNLQGV